MKSVRALLEGLIDYAGLFPPAALDMASAVRNYAAYAEGEHRWMLGKFVLPAARLGEFSAIPASERVACKLSLLEACEPIPAVKSIERKVGEPEQIRQWTDHVTTYFEIPSIKEAGAFIDVLAETGGRAKIRTGGLTDDMYPSSTDLARFLVLCASAKVPFKATAGLHHPIRSQGVMHGFLNLFLAAALVYSGGSEEDARVTLDGTSTDLFRFDDTGVNWLSHRLTTEQLREARGKFAISFGSCSFEEPVADLKALGLL